MLMFNSGVAGLGAASAAITSLQQSLLALAQVSGRPAVNPGPVDGVLGDQTMSAVAAGLQVAAEKIPQSETVRVISVALAFGATSSQAKTAVNNYASQLTILFKSAAAAFASGLVKPPTVTPATGTAAKWFSLPSSSKTTAATTSTATAKPWYTTWWGLAGITIGAFGLVYLLTAPKHGTAEAEAAA